jgi:hypothetical protein
MSQVYFLHAAAFTKKATWRAHLCALHAKFNDNLSTRNHGIGSQQRSKKKRKNPDCLIINRVKGSNVREEFRYTPVSFFFCPSDEFCDVHDFDSFPLIIDAV